MTKFSLAGFACALLFANVVSGQEYRMVTLKKKLQPITTTEMRFNWMSGGSPKRKVALDAAKVTNLETNESAFSLIVRYLGEHWFFIQPGKSLILSTDGEKIALITEKGSKDTRYIIPKSNNRVYEQAEYKVDKDLIIRISRAKKVEFTVIGGENLRAILRSLAKNELREGEELTKKFSLKNTQRYLIFVTETIY